MTSTRQIDSNSFLDDHSLVSIDKKTLLTRDFNKLSSSFSLMKTSKSKLDDLIKDTLQQAKGYKAFITSTDQKAQNELKSNISLPSTASSPLDTVKSIVGNLHSLCEWLKIPQAEQSTIKAPEAKVTSEQQQMQSNLNTIINVLEMTPFEEYYISKFWEFIEMKYIYRITIQPSLETDEFKKELKWKTEDNYIRTNLNVCNYVEVTIIKRRKNSLITQLVQSIRNNFFNWIMRMDENYNVLIKGVLKERYLTFENFFLIPFSELKNVAYIHLKVYFTIVDLLGDYSSEYDKSTFMPEQLREITNSYQALERIRKTSKRKQSK